MALSVCLDKLPPETRNMCYRYVFGPSKVMTPFRQDNITNFGDHLLQPGATNVSTKPLIDTSILTTCKTIHKEALDILYDGRAVRGDIGHFWYFLLLKTNFKTHVRRVEIDDWIHGYRHPMFRSALQILQDLPGIRSVIVLSDCLTLMHVSPDSLISPHCLARRSGMGTLTCVDIGRYKLCGRLNHIQIVHRKLVDMWPSVVNTPDGYDAVTDVLALIGASPLKLEFTNVPIWAAHTSLRRWVGLLDETTRVFHGINLLQDKSEEEGLLLARFEAAIRRPVLRDHNGNPTPIPRVLLGGLRPGADPVTLSWATELLSMNLAVYRSEESPDGQSDYYDAHWAEVDGGMHTFDAMSLHAASALNGEWDDHYLHSPFPFYENSLHEIYSLRLRTGRLFPPSLYQGAVSELTTAEVRQFFLLELALTYQGFEPTTQQRANSQSSQLLRRYMSATDLLDASEVESASLDDMVWAMGCIVQMFCLWTDVEDFQTVCAILSRSDDRTAPRPGQNPGLGLQLTFRSCLENGRSRGSHRRIGSG